MSSPNSQNVNSRPVLPSIQDLLSDRDFDKLRLQSPEPVPRVATASVAVSQPMAGGSTAPSLHEPILRSSCSPPALTSRSPKLLSRTAARSAPYPVVHPSRSPRLPETAGKAFEDHLPGLHLGSRWPAHEQPGQLSTAHQSLSTMDLPTYVLSADQCPPDDDRRHGCGICHRRFNRPSSLMIHMNSHTGAQPFKCPFPGCSRRFSVNSNMRRHYRNHREGAPMTAHAQPCSQSHPGPAPAPAPPSPPSSPRSSFSSRIADPARSYYSYSAGSASPSPLSSPAHTDDAHFDAPAPEEPSAYAYLYARSRSRSRSTVLPSSAPRAEDRDRPSTGARRRACTVPGCHCAIEAPGALRPAFSFQQGRERERERKSSTRSSLKHR